MVLYVSSKEIYMKTHSINQRNRYQKDLKATAQVSNILNQCRELLAILGNTLGLGAILLVGYFTVTGAGDIMQKFLG